MSTAPELNEKALEAARHGYEQGLGVSHVDCLKAAISAYLAALREAPVAVKALECPGADDPEERCPKPPHECTCWQVELDYHPKRIRSALTASPASHEVVKAATAVLASWDARMHGEREELRNYANNPYWSPRASMVDSEAIAALRAALAQVQGVDAYKAENAKHNWTGRGFSFDPGFLNLGREGDGNIGFAEADMQYERDDETGKDYVYCNVPASEFLALRDYLNKAFPVAAAPEQEKSNG